MEAMETLCVLRLHGQGQLLKVMLYSLQFPKQRDTIATQSERLHFYNFYTLRYSDLYICSISFHLLHCKEHTDTHTHNI